MSCWKVIVCVDQTYKEFVLTELVTSVLTKTLVPQVNNIKREGCPLFVETLIW